MSVRHLNIRDLTYLCAVAEHGSFSKAAIACAISQPAISDRIRHAEAVLETKIFERNKRAVLTTPRGEEIIEYARDMLGLADAIDEVAADHESPLTGRLNVGVIATLGPYLIPHLLKPLKRFPDLELILTEGLTDDLIDRLKVGALDVVIAALPIEKSHLRCTPVFFEPFIVAAPKGHPIGSAGSVASNKLTGSDMILLHDGHCLAGQALDVCPVRKKHGEQRLQATGLETLRNMIASGDRYTLLPALAVPPKPPLADMIDYLPLANKKVGRTIAVFSRNSSGARLSVEALTDLIVKNLPTSVDVISSH
jgi:LysR family transcriptional regulator, hydrogen peroxide-inducible genes activator